MKTLTLKPLVVVCFAFLASISVFSQIGLTDLVDSTYPGLPWDNDTLEIGIETRISWQFDRVDGTIANDSGIVAGSYWPNDPENWPAANGQELRLDELDINYAVFRFNGGASVFRSYGQWCRYTVHNENEGYYHFVFRGRHSNETDGFPVIATIETADSVHFIDSVVVNSFTEQTLLIENVGMTGWYATLDSVFIPEGTSVVRIDMPSVSDEFNTQGRFGEFGFTSTDSNLTFIEDTVSPFIFEHTYDETSDPANPLVFQIYLPDIIDTVKGVCFYVAGGIMNGIRWMTEVPGLVEHRNYYVQNNFAYMVANLRLESYYSYDYDTIKDWLANAIYESLEALADSTGHPELAYSPLFLFGHSNGARFSHHFILSQESRSIGAFLSRGANLTLIDDSIKEKGLEVPVMFVPGELDGGFTPAYIYDCYDNGRSLDALWAYAIEPGAEHNPMVTDSNMVLSYFRDAVKSRLPDSNYYTSLPKLKSISKEDGYLGSIDNFRFGRYECYPNDSLPSSWLPGFESALAWQRFAADNGSLIDTIGCPTLLNSVEENSLSIFPNPANDILNITGAEGESIFMYNLDGRLEKTIVYAKQSEIIDLTELKLGLYLIRVGNKTFKISVIK